MIGLLAVVRRAVALFVGVVLAKELAFSGAAEPALALEVVDAGAGVDPDHLVAGTAQARRQGVLRRLCVGAAGLAQTDAQREEQDDGTQRALLAQRLAATMRLPCGTGPAWRRPVWCAALFLCCGGATGVLTDRMPSCASGWRPASPSASGAGSWRHDVEVTVDATLVVRAPDGRIVALLHKGDRRAWECASPPTQPKLSS